MYMVVSPAIGRCEGPELGKETMSWPLKPSASAWNQKPQQMSQRHPWKGESYRWRTWSTAPQPWQKVAFSLECPLRKREPECLLPCGKNGARCCRHAAWSEGAGHSQTSWEEAVNPNLGEYWGDSLEGAVGPLVGYFLCRGVEGGGGPTIISILAA